MDSLICGQIVISALPEYECAVFDCVDPLHVGGTGAAKWANVVERDSHMLDPDFVKSNSELY